MGTFDDDDLWEGQDFPTAYSRHVAPYAAAMAMIREAVETIFGPAADLESLEATLMRGPEPHHEAEAIIDALQRVNDKLRGNDG